VHLCKNPWKRVHTHVHTYEQSNCLHVRKRMFARVRGNPWTYARAHISARARTSVRTRTHLYACTHLCICKQSRWNACKHAKAHACKRLNTHTPLRVHAPLYMQAVTLACMHACKGACAQAVTPIYTHARKGTRTRTHEVHPRTCIHQAPDAGEQVSRCWAPESGIRGRPNVP